MSRTSYCNSVPRNSKYVAHVRRVDKTQGPSKPFQTLIKVWSKYPATRVICGFFSVQAYTLQKQVQNVSHLWTGWVQLHRVVYLLLTQIYTDVAGSGPSLAKNIARVVKGCMQANLTYKLSYKFVIRHHSRSHQSIAHAKFVVLKIEDFFFG